jgi:hypothetical protein
VRKIKKKRVIELPKGLREFEESLGDLKCSRKLLRRLRHLPQANFKKTLPSFDEAMMVVRATEEAAEMARAVARRVATRAWEYAKRNWTIEELQKATGYDNE